MFGKAIASSVLFALTVSAAVIRIEIHEEIQVDSPLSNLRADGAFANICSIFREPCGSDSECCPGLKCDTEEYECRFKPRTAPTVSEKPALGQSVFGSQPSTQCIGEGGWCGMSGWGCCSGFACVDINLNGGHCMRAY